MLCSCKLADWTFPRPATFSFPFCTRVATLSLCAGDYKESGAPKIGPAGPGNEGKKSLLRLVRDGKDAEEGGATR